MSVLQYEVRAGTYLDSVVLMQLQQALTSLPDVIDAGAVMATPANREVLLQSDMLPEIDDTVKNDDLLIVVRAETSEAAHSALSQVNELMAKRRSTVSTGFRPRTLKSAVTMSPNAEWVLISVPGQYAADVADEALDLDKHVFLYSDNVSVEDEVRLKQKGLERGRLVMGPDCGTAIINGIGFGFANRVNQGNIGIVAASGTGLQAVASRVHQLGTGISHAIGTGGRDLKDEVGAITAQMGLAALAADPNTDVIILISKPPSDSIARSLLSQAQQIGKPVVVMFMGYAAPTSQLGNLYFANNLSSAADYAVDLLEQGQIIEFNPSQQEGWVRGLFSGGTLAIEAVKLLQLGLSPLYSNLSVGQKLVDSMVSEGHTILDLGEDEFTQGRLHPMIDNDLRLRRLHQEAAQEDVGIILLDVVLGEGAHPDPASELAPAISKVREEYDVEVVCILIGTDLDPQDIHAQRESLENAGAVVFDDTVPAVWHVLQMVNTSSTAVNPPSDISGPVEAINMGLESFYDSLVGQGAEAVHVDWRPPAGGNTNLMNILAKMKSKP